MYILCNYIKVVISWSSAFSQQEKSQFFLISIQVFWRKNSWWAKVDDNKNSYN